MWRREGGGGNMVSRLGLRVGVLEEPDLEREKKVEKKSHCTYMVARANLPETIGRAWQRNIPT